MRPTAFNYHDSTWDTGKASSLQKKVGILLGLKVFHTRALTGALTDPGLELVSGERFEALYAGSGAWEAVDLTEIQKLARQPFREIPVSPSTSGDDARLFDEIIYLKDRVISASILRNGIHPGSYRVGSSREYDAYQVIFGPDEQERWRFLASYSTEEEAVSAANDLRWLLVNLNVMSEGFHMIEHLLLRPMGQEVHTGVDVPEDFYSFKISVMFPNWTARFSDPAFRMVAAETVEHNCPAHVYPEFHWLEFETMKRFEGLYQSWLDLKCGESASPEDIDAASKQMISFILKLKAQRPGGEGKQS